MNRVYIAEKHEVAKALAEVLGIRSKAEGYYACGNDAVTWCAGHMLELLDLADYDERYKNWHLEDLPIVPIPWKYKPIKNRGKQLKVIRSLIEASATVVHAGDTDSEGQLLVDEILTQYKVNKPVKRILINDNNPRMIKKALNDLRDNADFYGLSQAALARSVGDQLYGFNMTRLYTLKAREKGTHGVFSVGRVQTPILGLIVRRDREIAQHKKAYFYVVSGQFTINGTVFRAIFQPDDNAPLDDAKRITSEDFAHSVVAEVTGRPAAVTAAKTEDKRETPPLPYDLLELQADAGRKFGIKPDQTLALTQQLREKKLITYNRSDCRFLNEEQHADAPLVLEAIAANASVLHGACNTAQPAIKSRCFNNSNVTAHHAIIPTEGRYNFNALSENEQRLYLLIARQYIAQFWEDKTSKVTTVAVSVADHAFKARSTEVVNAGWSKLYKNDQDNEDVHKGKAEDEVDSPLVKLNTGDKGTCDSAEEEKKATQAAEALHAIDPAQRPKACGEVCHRP